ncbi:puff-specific protein Bx42 [Coccinella septempunctata]|uniref:puff-specific protein Bx42 n=1 Tax=Coccinella septempunctata TaxID=41139 RepID=UPI001D08AB91|nr:puff-specific protein Bx42 [Coccinella septempunctata]
MSLSSFLPAPIQPTWDRDDERRQREAEKPSTALVSAQSIAPPYGQRRGWVPRCVTDYGDGGAFPEIHIAQYPLNMGQKGRDSTSNALAVQLDAEGKVKYDILARQGHSSDKIVYSKLSDLLPAEMVSENDESLKKPSQEEVDEITEKTRLALMKLTNSKIAAAMPVRCAERQGPAEFIRYTPSQQGAAFNSGAKQRIIRLVEAQVDPMEPPRFKINKKIPRGAPSPPPPVMHSPTRKTTVKEQKEWKIPPCISNYKNAKGYTVPLDKRLAADGRGLQQSHINEKFAKLAEALYIADRKAREAVETRAQLEKKLAQKEKEQKEEHLRQLAQKARDERAGIRTVPVEKLTVEEERERELLRQDRHKERARDRNLARAAPDKRSKLQRERERDISEQIALGMPARGQSGDVQFDQRLFGQAKGLGQGYNDDEGYNVYDKPWREGGSLANHLYRPSKNIDNDVYGEDLDKIIKTNRFVPDKEFGGTDRSAAASRSGPVQFEKEEDPFGLDQFLSQAKRASKRKEPEKRDDRDKKKRRD